MTLQAAAGGRRAECISCGTLQEWTAAGCTECGEPLCPAEVAATLRDWLDSVTPGQVAEMLTELKRRRPQ